MMPETMLVINSAITTTTMERCCYAHFLDRVGGKLHQLKHDLLLRDNGEALIELEAQRGDGSIIIIIPFLLLLLLLLTAGAVVCMCDVPLVELNCHGGPKRERERGDDR